MIQIIFFYEIEHVYKLGFFWRDVGIKVENIWFCSERAGSRVLHILEMGEF
jgi:hypothetical protein